LSTHDVWIWLAGLSTRGKLLVAASLVVTIELLFRRLAPKSLAYKRWTGFFEGIGSIWTAVLLAVIYLLSVGPMSVFNRAFGKDPLDRTLAPEPSFWRSHEPNPLGVEASTRHQF
jgi:hypothetical protein